MNVPLRRCSQDVLIVAHNLKGDITTSVVIAGEGYSAHGQGFISGAVWRFFPVLAFPPRSSLGACVWWRGGSTR